MKLATIVSLCALALSVTTAFASTSSHDLEIAAQAAKKDLALKAGYAAHDQELLRAERLSPQAPLHLDFLLPTPSDSNNGCLDSCVAQCNGGSGASACWTACQNEGYSSTACASRCGTSTDAGSQACWTACDHEGYSSTACVSRCGTTTNDGSAACWTACGHEGYSSVACAERCGISTSAGSAACWDACTHEGYSSAACASRCGTN